MRIRDINLIVVCGLLLALPTTSLAPPARAEKPKVLATLRRNLDPIVIEGREMREFLGAEIKNLRLMALRNGTLEVVPFQIDERRPDGTFAFTHGEGAAKDVYPGILDGNDELVFKAESVGDRLTHLAGLAGERVIEIEVVDPLDKRRGWLYLVRFKRDPPPKSKRHSVRIKVKDGVVYYTGDGFKIDNARATGNALRNSTLKFLTKSGGESRNLLDTTKMQGVLYYFALPVRRDGSEIRAKIGAYLCGPIRAIVRNDIEVLVAWDFWIRSSNSLIYYYDFGTVSPTCFDFPINVDRSPMSYMRVSTDLSTSAKNWSFYNSENPKPLPITGKKSKRSAALNRDFPSWNVVYGPEGAMIHRLLFSDPKINARAGSKLHYSDDVSKPDAPEFEIGSFGDTGFVVDFSGTRIGTSKAMFYTYYPRDFRFGDEARYLKIVDHPISFKVRAVSQTGATPNMLSKN